MDTFKLRFKNMRSVIDKIRVKQASVSPDSRKVRAAMTKAAAVITAQAKVNVRRHGLIDTGRLINSLRWEFYRREGVQGIRIGSFGVPYAAFWEFGYHGSFPVRAHNRLITRAFGKPLKQAVVARVRTHTRRVDQTAKPYLRPAYELHKDRVVQYILEAL
jgi:hypothetical protein